MLDQPDFLKLLGELRKHQEKYASGFSLVPSENLLSPMSRMVYLSDVYSRYYFDEDRASGDWAFPGGRYIGCIEEEILLPALKRLANATFVNVKPISGMNAMMVLFAATCRPGDTIFILPSKLGGHRSTRVIAANFGLTCIDMPLGDPFSIDLSKLAEMCNQHRPKLIYLDPGSGLFPLPVAEITRAVNAVLPYTRVHLDSSHTNGLIFGGVHENPLESGADSFGGSTHKTFGGPHKGFLATNDGDLSAAFKAASMHLVSHHHGADVVALAVSLLEFERCDGPAYARQTLENAKAFAARMVDLSFDVVKKGDQHTGSHQVWVKNTHEFRFQSIAEKMFHSGIIVNVFGALPVSSKGGLRLGFSEATRIGATPQIVEKLAEELFALSEGEPVDAVRGRVTALRQEAQLQKYCWQGIESGMARTLSEFLEGMGAY